VRRVKLKRDGFNRPYNGRIKGETGKTKITKQEKDRKVGNKD
jgi:hypothetical protein